MAVVIIRVTLQEESSIALDELKDEVTIAPY